VPKLGHLPKESWLRELARFAISKPSQLREKSEQWFRDTQCLHDHQRWSAVVYLGGFVIECLLKCALWPRRTERRVIRLLWRSHDLYDLLDACPETRTELNKPPFDAVRSSFDFLANWAVRIRHNPKRLSQEEGLEFWRRLKEVRTWLRGRA
jgi:hypothetical protein